MDRWDVVNGIEIVPDAVDFVGYSPMYYVHNHLDFVYAWQWHIGKYGFLVDGLRKIGNACFLILFEN